MTQIKQWVENFHRDGYVVIPDVLTREECYALINEYKVRVKKDKRSKKIQKCMFEDSPLNADLFFKSPILEFARKLISNTQEWDNHMNQMYGSNAVHVFHNNSFLTKAGKDGLGGNNWHQDDSPHFFLPEGQKLPKGFRLNVLAFTVNYYLTDVTEVENGPTQVIAGSHLFGKACPSDISKYESKLRSCLGKAGTAVCFNNQVWHRGSRNDSDRDRYITQISYGKRLVGHKFGSVMNYQMPEHLYEGKSDDEKKVLGFLSGGAYG